VRLTHERFRADVQGLVKALQGGLAEIEAQHRAEAEAARIAEEARRLAEVEALRKKAELEEEERRAEAEALRRKAELEEAQRLAEAEALRKKAELEEAERRAATEALRKKAELEEAERAAEERRRLETEAKLRTEAERAFAIARRTGTVAALDAFLAAKPDSIFADEAIGLKTKLLARADAYQRAAASENPIALKSFIATYKSGEDVDQIRGRLRAVAPGPGISLPKPALIGGAAVAAMLLAAASFVWFQGKPPPLPANVAASDSQPSLQAGKGPENVIPPRTDDVAWSLLKDTTDEAALYRFIGRYPTSTLRKDAEARIAELEAEKAAKAKADAEAAAKAQAERDKADAAARAAQAEIEAERAKAAAAAQAAKEQVALATPPDASHASTPLSGSALIQAIKMELARVGCYAGKLDDDWSSSSLKLSIVKFVKAASLGKVPDNPTSDFLDAIRGRPSRVCPLECAKTEKELNGTCVAKTCPAGQTLDSDGDCETTKARTASRPAPEAPAPDRPAASERPARGGRGGNNHGRADSSDIAGGNVGIICNKTGCHTKQAHTPPAGVPCAKAIQDRMGAWHCS
jgi:hypothetical protein